MANVTAKAPGVIKLFGEHAVVYGKLAVAAAISTYATTEVSEAEGNTIKITLLDIDGLTIEADETALIKMYKTRKSVPIDQYVREVEVDSHILPCLAIAARMIVENKAKVIGKKVIIRSDIPMKRGLASSAAISTSFAVALAKSSGIKLFDTEMVDLAREGERAAHVNEGAGAIDVSTSYYGGFVSYNKERGAVKEDIQTELNILLIDTGPKKSTAETVGQVAALYKTEKERVEDIMAKIEQCSTEGLVALKTKDFETLGRLMYENQDLLASLGVSSEGLDRAVRIAKDSRLLGAKLSGGGGGGIAIAAVANKDSAIIKAFEAAGFSALFSEISLKGAGELLS